MKNLLLITLLAGLLTFQVNAQENFSFGVKSGVNLANLSGGGASLDSRTGFHIGAVAELFLWEDKFAIQPELIYSQQGAVSNTNLFVEGISFSIAIKNDYINVPVLGKYYPTKGLSLEAGPYFGFNVKSELEIETMGFEGTEDLNEEVSTFDFGSVLGVGYELPIGIFFQARYMFGVSDIGFADGDEIVRNQLLQFSAGFKF